MKKADLPGRPALWQDVLLRETRINSARPGRPALWRVFSVALANQHRHRTSNLGRRSAWKGRKHGTANGARIEPWAGGVLSCYRPGHCGLRRACTAGLEKRRRDLCTHAQEHICLQRHRVAGSAALAASGVLGSISRSPLSK